MGPVLAGHGRGMPGQHSGPPITRAIPANEPSVVRNPLPTNPTFGFHEGMSRKMPWRWRPDEPLFGDADSRRGDLAIAAALGTTIILVILLRLAG